MWLLTAVGPVHGQLRFTFALEQRKSYTVGRDKSCLIRFESRYVKPLQGSVIVGDWDPTNPSKQPEIRWKSEPSKKGVHPSFRTVVPNSPEDIGSLDKDDYARDEIPEGTPGCFLNDNGGMGIELGEGCWFTVHWEDLSFCYDKMKDEPDTIRETLRRYCMTWSPKFEENFIPDLVVSSTFRGSAECNNAVIHGIRIVTPSYLEVLVQKFTACWKLIADSEDSFAFPDVQSVDFRPTLDTGLPNVRNSVDCWEPDPRRKTLFKGWKIMGLKNRTVPIEKRWLVAMGADYTDIDISRSPPKTPDEFAEKLQDWVAEVQAEGSTETSLVVHFMRVKEEFAKAHLDFNTIVGTACQGFGIVVCSGNVTWGAVREGGVQAYIDAVRPDRAKAIAATKAKAPAAVKRPSEKQTATPPASQPSQIPSSSAVQPASQIAIPSTFPEETEVVAPPSAQKEKIQEAFLPTGTASVRKPLRKRAAAKKVDLFSDDLSVVHESAYTPMDRDPSPPVSQMRTEPATQYSQPVGTQTNTLAPASRLKRRAGPETQRSQFSFGFDDSFDADQKAAEAAAEIRELYEQTKAESRATQGPPSKRQKIISTSVNGRPESAPGSRTRDQHSLADTEMPDIHGDDDEEIEEIEDPIQKRLRKAREARTQSIAPGSMAPPALRQPGQRSPSEETEEVESVKKTRTDLARPAMTIETKKSREQRDASEAPPTQDTAFLQAITKASKTKKAMDELDREFNNLRIPRPSGKSKDAEVTTKGLGYDHPDWNLVDEFNDDLRGNFIQIVRKDLFRKDKPLDRYIGVGRERLDDGRPNFKKFKKKSVIRRDPVRLVLAGPTLEDAEMGEPYWPSETMRTGKRSQVMSQMPGSLVEDDEMPLLPSTNKRLLRVNEDSEDDQLTMSSRRKGQHTAEPSTLDSSGPSRRTRAASVASAVSDVPSMPPTRTRKAKSNKPAASAAKGRGKKVTAAIVIEDSEDEVAVDLDRTPAPSGSTRSMRGTRATDTSTVRGDPTPTTSGETRIPGTSMAPGPSTGNARGRRRLLDAEDEVDTAPFKVLEKTRRIR